MFDQRVIPDFAFQITKVLPPGEVKIGEQTLIQVERGELKKFPRIKGNIRFNYIVGHEGVKK